MSDDILVFENIGRSFFGVAALSAVNLNVGRGRVLGLIGQNGAGKSTLMNIAGGVLGPDTGAMLLDGAPYSPVNPRDAGNRGIAFIHQELNLFTNLSIAENIFIAGFPRRRWRLIDRAALRAKTASLLAEVNLDVAPGSPLPAIIRASMTPRVPIKMTRPVPMASSSQPRMRTFLAD